MLWRRGQFTHGELLVYETRFLCDFTSVISGCFVRVTWLPMLLASGFFLMLPQEIYLLRRSLLSSQKGKWSCVGEL